MAFYYVDSTISTSPVGDAGRSVSERTGTFDAMGGGAVYPSILAALSVPSTPFTNADEIRVADRHEFDNVSTTISYAFPLNHGGKVICVDSANAENYRTLESTRAVEKTSSGTSADVNFLGAISIWGMQFESADNIAASGSSNVILYDCRLMPTDNMSSSADAGTLKTFGCEFDFTGDGRFATSGGAVNVVDNAKFNLIGGSPDLMSGGFTGGGGSQFYTNSDLSIFTSFLLAQIGGAVGGDDAVHVEIDRCTLGVGVVFVEETLRSLNQRMIVTRSSAVSAEAEYQFFTEAFGGEINDDDVIRRAEDPAFTDSGVTISYKIETNTDASVAAPLWFDIPLNKFAALSVGSSDTLRFYIVSTSTLDNSKFYIKVSNPNGTNKNETDTITSAETIFNSVPNPLATPVTLTTDSGSDWRNGASALVGYNEYQVDLVTSGGLDSYTFIRFYITEPSIVIHIGMGFDLV